MSGHCMEEILQLLEERIMERMSTSEQLTNLIEQEVSTRWEHITLSRLDQLEKSVNDLQLYTTPRKRFWEDRVKRLESSVLEMRQQLASGLSDAGCLASKDVQEVQPSIKQLLPAAARKPNAPVSPLVQSAVQAVRGADRIPAARCRLPSMSRTFAVALFVFGPLVQLMLWVTVLIPLVPGLQSIAAGVFELDEQLSMWFPVGWWHITQLTGRMHSLATLAAGPATPCSLRIGNMFRSLTMYLPGVVYCAAHSMVGGAAFFTIMTVFGTSDCSLDHPFVLEVLKAVLPCMGELDAGMCWRIEWLRQHRARAGDVLRAELLRTAGSCLGLLVPYAFVGQCAVSNRLIDGHEDQCLGTGLANLLIGVSVTWLCSSSAEELFLPLAPEHASFAAGCWSLGFAPAASVALGLLIKDAGDVRTLCPEFVYALCIWAVAISITLLLSHILKACCCKRCSRKTEAAWQHAADACGCAYREAAEAKGLREQLWSESWPLVTGPWGTVCVSPRTQLPLFVVEYPSCAEIVDLRCLHNSDDAQHRDGARRAKAKGRPRRSRSVAPDVSQAMLRQVIGSHMQTSCRRLSMCSRDLDWPAVLIWALNLAELDQVGNQGAEQRQQKAHLAKFAGRPTLVCEVPLQRRTDGWLQRRRPGSQRFALRLSQTRVVDTWEKPRLSQKLVGSPPPAASSGSEPESDSTGPAGEHLDVDSPRSFRTSQGDLLPRLDDGSDGAHDDATETNGSRDKSPCSLRSSDEGGACSEEAAESPENVRYDGVSSSLAPERGEESPASQINLRNNPGFEHLPEHPQLQLFSPSVQPRSSSRPVMIDMTGSRPALQL